MNLNNKGFTLVELLAVLVILIAISSIAIPTISSSLDRNKEKQFNAKKKLVESAAELYVTDHKNDIYGDCFVMVSDLMNENYFDEDEDIPDTTCVKYNFSDKKFIYISKESDCNSGASCKPLPMVE